MVMRDDAPSPGRNGLRPKHGFRKRNRARLPAKRAPWRKGPSVLHAMAERSARPFVCPSGHKLPQWCIVLSRPLALANAGQHLFSLGLRMGLGVLHVR